ncbi:unnamed protein product [Ascophyllum nodosum]
MGVEFAVIGFHPLESDPCAYTYEDNTGFVILTLYVDVILSLDASRILLNKLKKKLMDRLEISDMGDREKRAIIISQKDYTDDVVHRYGMEGCNSAYTPGVGP